MTHEHNWETVSGGPSQHAKIGATVLVHYEKCVCGAVSFMRPRSRVRYIVPNRSTWSTEADHEAAQVRKSPLARARRP